MLDKIFRLKGHKTTIRTEMLAGLTTFMTMAYIIFVQPQVLGAAGMDTGSVMVATCIASAIACLFMGLLANYPIGLAPGMGENFFFAYTVVLAMGIGWEKALGMVLISGLAFIALSIFKVREIVINAVPRSLKLGIAAGIGLFIAYIGFINAGFVTGGPLKIGFGYYNEPAVVLSIISLALVTLLIILRVKGAILLGIIATTIVGVLLGLLRYKGLVSRPPSISPTLFKFDLLGLFHWEYLVPILTFLYMDLFDTIGTLIGVSSQAGLMRNDKLPRASRALFSDAVGTVAGAICGTSTVTSYIESVTGVRAGGRTGLTAVVIALLFLVALFFYPVVDMVSGGVVLKSGGVLHPVTAPALIVVGAMMTWGISKIGWRDFTEVIPALLTLFAIPVTFSIADGIAVGFISYPVLKLASGRWREANWLVYLLAVVFILRYIFL